MHPEMYDELLFYSSVARSQFIPTVDVPQIKHYAAPWTNNELRSLIRKKKKLR